MSSLSLRARAAASALALSALIGTTVALPATSAAAAVVADASNETVHGSCCGSGDHWGQSFTAIRSGALTSFEVRDGFDTAAPVELFDVSDGMPTSRIASGRVTTSTGGWTRVEFADPAIVTAGTRYAIAFQGTMHYASNNPYAGGDLLNLHVGQWIRYADQLDMAFRVFVDAEPPTVAGSPAPATRDAGYGWAFTIGGPASTSTVTGLPAGLSMSDAGVVSGVPTVSGHFPLVVTTRGNGQTVTHGTALSVTAAPTAVRELTAAGTGSGIALAWSAPADGGNAGAVSYRVSWRPVGSTGTPASQVVTGPASTIENLGTETDWDVSVVAVNSLGAGPAAHLEGVSPLVAPTAVTSLASAESDGALTVTWGAPASTGGAPVTYEASVDGAGWAPATSPLVLDGANGAPVSVDVRARNRTYEGPAASTGGTPRTVPDAATGLVATPGSGSVELAWTADGFDGGSPVTGWLVEHREVGDGVWIGSEPTEGAARTATVSGLEDGTAYGFRVTPVNEAGEGAASPVATATPFRAADAAELTLDARGDRSLDVSWIAGFDGGRDVDAWRVEVRAIGDEAWAQHGDLLAGDASSATIDGLAVGAEVEVRVTAITEAGDGAASAPVSTRVLGLATAATAIRTSAQDGAIDVSWAAPESDGGSPVTHYLVGSAEVGSRSGDEVEVVGTSVRLAGLANGSTVAIVVTPVTEAGRGEATRVEATPFAFAPVVVDASGRPVAEAARGQQLTIRAEGLPEGTVSIELHSTPVALGTATVGADGVLQAQVTIPADAELGRHDLVLALASEVADVRTAAIPLQVSSAPVAATPAAQALASTGSEALPFALGGLLLLLGGALVRRRAGIRSAARG